MSAFSNNADHADKRNKQKISVGTIVTVGNSGVTEVGVVERGELQRCEAGGDRIDSRGMIFEVQSGAGGGELPRE